MPSDLNDKGRLPDDDRPVGHKETGRLRGTLGGMPLMGFDSAEESPQESQFRYKLVPLDETRRTYDTAVAQPWRILISPVGMTADWLALELLGDCMIGSNPEPNADLDVNLVGYDGWSRGVSRRHAMLRPSRNKLFIMDMRSTNGTQINGLPLGIGWAYALKDNDMISLAKLHLRVRILQRPTPPEIIPPNPFDAAYKR